MPSHKREIGQVLQKRLQILMHRSGMNQSQFALSIGVNRSALAQLLSERIVRMPRAETLHSIALVHKVSVDWLLGLSQEEGLTPQVSSAMAIEQAKDGEHTRLGQWHQDAIGYKIRYVPARLPDSLMLEEVIDYERESAQVSPAIRKREASLQLAYNRITESEMEVCMPLQQLTMLAQGAGIWAGLPQGVRRRQLAHMAQLLDDLYPTYRLFLYDGLKVFSAPFTVFGSQRVAIYMGDMYVVINKREEIRALTSHFDQLIRQAVTNPHEAAGFVRRLLN